MPPLKRIARLVRFVENWYDIPLYHARLKTRVIVRVRNGPRFVYKPRAFSLEQFAEEPYRRLDVMGRTVVDIGAFNGDSALYFLSKGAAKVLAFEPYPYTYNLALENISLNPGSNILLYNEAVSAYDGWVRLDPGYRSRMGSSARDRENGLPVRVRTLASIVSEFELADAALKLDCEGCEYDVILNSDMKTLKAFSEVILEYHYSGYLALYRKLETTGFKVEALLADGTPAKEPPSRLGLLYAQR